MSYFEDSKKITDKLEVSNILIVEDNEGHGKSLDLLLRKVGYNVYWVHSGEEAVSFILRENAVSIHVALIDIGLPDMSGIEILREIKKRDSETETLIMTGNSDIQTAIHALNEGAFAYILKPYSIEEILQTINKILEKQTLIREKKILTDRLKDWNIELGNNVKEKTKELEVKNISLLKMVDQLKESNESKSRFIRDASHEMQTPMTSIIGYSSILMQYWEKIDKAEAQTYHQIIQNEARRLSRLARNLLELSRSQEGRKNLNHEKIDLLGIVEKTIKEVKMINDTVSIEVTFDQNARQIISDKDRCDQLLLNLMANAVKYSPNGGHVRVEGIEKGNGIRVSIKDEGPGIPIDQRENIFEPFYRIIDDIGQEIRGTGLGLPISKAIVQALGGDIHVDSGPGQGSNFSFVLPKDITKNK